MSGAVLSPGAKFKDELIATAKAITAPGKGILASDESTGTAGKRLATIGVEGTEENCRTYRELLYTTEGLGEHISGAIMFEKTLYEKSDDGKQFVDILKEQGIIPGIKVDKGLKPLPGSTTGEQWTSGLDGLAERCAEYYKQGARFCKWRNVLTISDTNPTDGAIIDCVNTLAKYAAIAQTEGLVPIVEPEIMLDGNHSMETARRVHAKVWEAQYHALAQYGVMLEGSLFKPSMIVPGADVKKESPEVVAQVTVDTLLKTVPAMMPGVTFLSGGQSEEEATLHIHAMNTYRSSPWALTFSFGRALQASVLKAWGGKAENKKAAQDMLRALSQVNGMAAMGKYNKEAGHPSTTGSLYVKDYKY
jgi:fructose-bisphosphate aldolase class I